MVTWRDVKNYDECLSLTAAVKLGSWIEDNDSGTVDEILVVDIEEDDETINHIVMGSWTLADAREEIALLDA